MKNLKFALLLLTCLTLTIYACKKEIFSDAEVTKQHFIGKWPLKSLVKIEVENGVTTLNDTTFYSPVDTLYFTADGDYTKGNVTAKYNIDDAGENLTISTTPEVKWVIKYLRKTSIVLAQERTENVGNNKVIYYTEQNLVK